MYDFSTTGGMYCGEGYFSSIDCCFMIVCSGSARTIIISIDMITLGLLMITLFTVGGAAVIIVIRASTLVFISTIINIIIVIIIIRYK